MNYKQLLIIAFLASILLIQPAKSQNSKCFFYNNVNTGLNDLLFAKQMDLDSRNHKWFATESSILMFNNISWEKKYIGNFNSILMATDTTLYAVDNLGFLNVINVKTNQISKYLLFQNYSKVKDGTITIKKDSQGKIWIAGDNFASALRNEVFTNAKFIGFDKDNNAVSDLSSIIGSKNSTVKAFAIDNNDNKWLIAYGYNPVIKPDTMKIDGDIYALKYDGNTWTKYNTGYRTGTYCDYNSIVTDNENNIWVGNDYTGLVKFDGVSPISFNTDNSGIPSDYVNDIAVDKQNVKWVIVEGSKIASFDDAVWTVYDSTFTNLNVEFNKILKIDPYGNKWILSKSNGIVVFNENGVNLGKNMISGHIYYDGDTFFDKVPQQNLTVNLIFNSEIVATTTTDDLGFYSFTELQNGTYKVQPVITREWSGSDPGDALIILKYFTGNYSFKYSLTKLAADVNKDRLVNPTDALSINRRFIGISQTFPAGDWLDDNTNSIIDGFDVTHDIMIISVGDLNGTNRE